VLQWSEKTGTVEKRFLSRKTVRDPGGTATSIRSPSSRPGLKPRIPSEESSHPSGFYPKEPPSKGAEQFWRRINRLFVTVPFEAARPQHRLSESDGPIGQIRGVAVERENWNRRKAVPEPENRPRPPGSSHINPLAPVPTGTRRLKNVLYRPVTGSSRVSL